MPDLEQRLAALEERLEEFRGRELAHTLAVHVLLLEHMRGTPEEAGEKIGDFLFGELDRGRHQGLTPTGLAAFRKAALEIHRLRNPHDEDL